jgi:HEAT repeat protein
MGRGLRRILLTALIVAAANFLLWGFDGPFWLLSVPNGIDPALRVEIARLHSWRGSTRADAALLLGLRRSAAAQAAPYLVAHLDDTGYSEGFFKGASQMFAFHGGPKIVLTDVYEALLAIGTAAVPALIGGLGDPDFRTRMASAELLGLLKDPRAIPDLRKAERDPDASVAAHARTALLLLHATSEN